MVQSISYNKFVTIIKNIFFKSGYKISYEQSEDSCFDFIARDENRQYGVDVKLQPRSYKALVTTLQYDIERAIRDAKGKDYLPVLVINGIVSDAVIAEVNEKYSPFDIVDISNLLTAVPKGSEIRNRLLSVIPYSTNEIVPKESGIILPWIEHESYEQSLIKELQSCGEGKDRSSEYERICERMLKAIFDDQLTLWKSQKRSNKNLYIFDLLCRIKDAHNSSFWGIVEKNFFSKYVVFEFKNYSDPIKQEQIYTTEKYLYSKALRTVAIIVSPKGADKNALWAANGAFRESGKLILVITSDDLVTMLKIKMDGEDPAAFLLDMLDDLLMNLEI